MEKWWYRTSKSDKSNYTFGKAFGVDYNAAGSAEVIKDPILII
jgi:hypothetical protein